MSLNNFNTTIFDTNKNGYFEVDNDFIKINGTNLSKNNLQEFLSKIGVEVQFNTTIDKFASELEQALQAHFIKIAKSATTFNNSLLPAIVAKESIYGILENKQLCDLVDQHLEASPFLLMLDSETKTVHAEAHNKRCEEGCTVTTGLSLADPAPLYLGDVMILSSGAVFLTNHIASAEGFDILLPELMSLPNAFFGYKSQSYCVDGINRSGFFQEGLVYSQPLIFFDAQGHLSSQGHIIEFGECHATFSD